MNIITYFSIIHFLHNTSFSILKNINENLIWIAPINLSQDSINSVLNINMIGYVAFCVTILLFAKKKDDFHFRLSKSHLKRLNIIYLVFLIFSIPYYINHQYGQLDQSLTSLGAFNPIKRILDLRYYLAVIIILFSNKKGGWKFVFAEIIFSILGGGRKALMIVVGAFILFNLKRIGKINLLRTIKYFSFSSFIIYFLIFVRTTRTLNIPIIEKIYFLNGLLIDNFFKITSQVFVLANSEGVQNWTFQLINSNSLNPLFGLSYIQAIINLVLLRPFQGNIADWQAAYVFKSVAYPNETNQGWDYSFTAEAILNWGDKLAFISYAILAIFISLTNNNSDKNIYSFIVSNSIFPILLVYFRTDSTSLLRAIFMTILIFWITKKQIKWKREF